MKLKFKILLNILLFFIFNSVFAQENPHERLVNRLKQSGLTKKGIQDEINKMDVFYQNHTEEEFQRIQDKFNKNNAQKESQIVTCSDIPASEKAVLQSIYNQLNGSSWATNWDFNTPVTSWNATNGTGWFGIVVNNCHVEQFTVNNINVQGVFPDVTELTHLKNLSIGHGMYGHSLPYYITGDFSSIGNLPLLNSLNLHNADFQGEIPLTFNNLDENFWGLTLAHCNLSDNSQLCSIISNFSNLDYLNLSHNFFSGVFPNCFSGNNFSGLKQILMGSNNFSDISIIETHTNLQTLWFGNNLIQGNFPNLSNNLNLSNTILELNQIEGQIPNNFPGNVYVLRLSHNKLEGNIPLLNYYTGINYRFFDVRNNKYKFKDFENNFNYYQSNFTEFFYVNQARTDTVINQTVSAGSTYTMTMHVDGNDSSVEQYQWYKGVYPNGTLINGATQRQLVFNSVTQADAGSYYCVSTHPTITIPSNSLKNLILVREPINLSVNSIEESCTATNPNTPVVKQLFINLLNHLITLPSVPDSYTCPELTLLAPYVQPDAPVAIYNFLNDGAQIKFSFSDHGNVFDVWIVYSQSTVQDIDLSNYVSYDQVTSLDHKVITLNGITKGSVKHIEFCPDELYCKKHIAIVVDESGSIDESEVRKIKAQLKSFIEQQTQDNETLGTNIHVSLIGLSESDTNNRVDHVMGDSKLTSSNKPQYLTWINQYRNGRVSPNSDYWKSGLDKAYDSGAELVILITDGCQTTNAGELQQTIRKFNNNGGGSSSNAPHLYVIGLDNGFYVDSDTPLNRKKSLTPLEDPNLNPSLQRSAGENSRVTSYLRTSLKYLMNYPANEFPVNDKYNFIYRPLDGSSNPVLQMVDYFGANDFDFLSDEPNYIYNGSVRANVSCGDEIPLDICNNCLNFKPIPGKEYVVSAWVKEELKQQVKSYVNAEIHINFKDYTDEGYIPNTEVICQVSGDIIDDWQRIFKKFEVPANAVYVEIALVNNSGSIPVYFDDIRIHPIDGSMKSFVYDPETFRLLSELDENNFSTFYEYDNEGGLIRVKKETSRGIKTIQETRSGNVIKVD